MESEKVKKIKKVLEQNTKTCLLYDFEKNTECKVFQCKYILDYINELESENRELKKYKCDWLNSEKMHLQAELEDTEFEFGCANRSLQEVSKENKQLKERLAELEKEIEENAFYSKGYAQGIKNTYEVVVPDKLKQFAEKVIENLKDNVNADNVDIFVQGKGIMEETLKEFLND